MHVNGVMHALGLHLRSLPLGRSFSHCHAPFEKQKKKADGYAKDVPDEARIRRRTSSDVDFRKTVFIYIVVFLGTFQEPPCASIRPVQAVENVVPGFLKVSQSP